jgi:hypothetical protein
MKRFNCLAALAALAAGLAFCATPARAQIGGTPPIVVKEKPPKPVWMKAVVIRADARTIMVREEENSLMIHTFTYSQKAREKMEKILDGGPGFQSGDKVKILHLPDTNEALDFKGKPSKPL